MKVLSGMEVSKLSRQKITKEIQRFKLDCGRAPGLAVILVGQDPASQVYVRNKGRACQEVGIESFEYKLSAETSPTELKQLIHKLNADDRVHGILVQLPLPVHLNSEEALSWISPLKDPDALTVENMGLCWKGTPRVSPCTPSGVMAILEHYNVPVSGKRAVVVGRSSIVGKPMAQLLQMADATVTVCHSKTPDISNFTKEADIVVVAAGKPLMFGREDFKQGSVVVDVGIHRCLQSDGSYKLCGDVKFSELNGWVNAATPVPGGVGPMTITMLLQNTLTLALSSIKN